jgi:diphthine synthase
VGCSALGSPRQTLFAGTPEELKEHDFGAPPHFLIIPGSLHFLEEEALNLLR